ALERIAKGAGVDVRLLTRAQGVDIDAEGELGVGVVHVVLEARLTPVVIRDDEDDASVEGLGAARGRERDAEAEAGRTGSILLRACGSEGDYRENQGNRAGRSNGKGHD